MLNNIIKFYLSITDSLVAQGKESTCNAGDTASNPGSVRSSEEENGNSLQYSCLRNPMSRGTWSSTVYGVTKELDTNQQLNNHDH